MGRPSTYSEEKAEKVCEVFAQAHGSLRSVFESRDDLPPLSTVYDWEHANPAFSERLQRARAARAHIMADEALRIADGSEHDGDEKPDHEWINRSRLRVETRLRLAKAMNQAAYGDKTQQSGSLEVVYRIHLGSKPE